MIINIERNLEMSEFNIIFDGLKNFQNSIHLFSLAAFNEDEFVVFDPMTNIFYWQSNNEFFINTHKPRELNSSICTNTDLIPISLAICWKKSNYIKSLEITNDDSVIVFQAIEKNFSSFLE
jgi:hypothetical protein